MSVALFEDIINEQFWLERKDGRWLVVEGNQAATNKKAEICGCQMLVFSLDQNKLDPLPFIKHNTTKKGMRSVCDAMIVTSYQEKTYFCALDMKSGKANSAPKQIESARQLFAWLLGLAKFHGHWSGEFNDDYFFGIIHLPPRKTERKGETRRSTEITRPDKSHGGAYPIFTLKNHPIIDLAHVIAKL
jgi:hypothetical protein